MSEKSGLKKVSFEKLIEKALEVQNKLIKSKAGLRERSYVPEFLNIVRAIEALKQSRKRLIHDMSDFIDLKDVKLEVNGPKNEQCPHEFNYPAHPVVKGYNFKVRIKGVALGGVKFSVYGKVAFASNMRTYAKGRGFGGLLWKKSLYYLFEEMGIKKVISGVSEDGTEDFIPSLFTQLRCRMRLIGYESYKTGGIRMYYTELLEEDFKKLKQEGVIKDRKLLQKIWEKAQEEMKEINAWENIDRA